jgi:predicted nucleic acid-binding protein
MLRFLDDEAGVERVSHIFQDRAAKRARVVMSAVHYGEVIGLSYKRNGLLGAGRIAARFDELQVQVVDATPARASHSAMTRVDRKIPYADCFGIDLALDSPQHILITADFDFKPAERDIRIEFLPAKSVSH